MKTIMKKYIFYIFASLLILNSGCTNLDEIYYSEVSQNTFFQTKNDIYAALARPYTRWRGIWSLNTFQLNEITTDEICVTQKGADFESGGIYRQLHWHTWNPDHSGIYTAYTQLGQGISYPLAIIKELSNLDYTKYGLTEEDKQNHILQLKVLAAHSYLRALDFFGGMPIYREYTTLEKERSTAQETFDFIEETLLEAISDDSPLRKKTLGEREDGWVNQGNAAACLAKLYFNSEVYTGKERWEDCAKVCEDIIAGKYGEYKLESTWNAVFGFNNHLSTELIWSFASDYNWDKTTWYYSRPFHYNSNKYFDIDGMGASNGSHLQPSLKPNGDPYDFKLGMPFSRFNDKDLRKKPYLYKGNAEYEGMFLYGRQERVTYDGRTVSCTGLREYMGEVITFVDQVAQFSKVGTVYGSVEDLPSTIQTGEENTGVRLVKVPVPDNRDQAYRYGSDIVIIRLAEIYYTLAECKYRMGDKQGAADLFNEVRKRNFENEQDPDPCTAENLNKYRILQEWMIEFIGEARRRTDLRRWNAYTTETWWDHNPSEHYRELYPIPQRAISASNVNLKQNPGYGGDEMSAEDAGLFTVKDVD